MALTYDGAGGLFTRLGKVVRASIAFEQFEDGSLATIPGGYTALNVGTDLATELSDIMAELEVAYANDRRAIQELIRIREEYFQTLQAWKQDIVTPIVQQILTQQMDSEEGFYSADFQRLLDRLLFCMDRDAETVVGSEVTLTAAAAGTPAPVGDFEVIVSKAISSTAGSDSALDDDGSIWSNQYEVVCIDNNTEGAELFSVRGQLPRQSRTHPRWENAGEWGRLQIVSSTSGASIALNGGFEDNDISGTGFTNWSIVSGVWNTDITVEVGAGNFYRDAQSVEFSKNAKIRQTFSEGQLRPNTKYFVALKYKVANLAIDGDLDLDFNGAEAVSVDLAAVADTNWHTASGFINTGDDPDSALTLEVERSGNTTNHAVFVDEVVVYECPSVHGAHIAVYVGATNPELNDYWTVGFANDHAGIFQTFFNRWFDRLLPGVTDSSETIDDALAE